ncbi:MAG: hypothetical protein QOF78_3687 [Phycisphaerales bacterium]|jgi:hypothetical protein|nr:hypothetical protein [Phycisphaerales bacterium]
MAMPSLRIVILCAVAATFIAGNAACDRKQSGSTAAGGAGPGGSARAGQTYKPAGRLVKQPDLRAAGATPQFKAAIASVQKLTGSAAAPLMNEDEQPTGAVTFKAPHAKVEQELTRWHRQLLAQGAYLVRSENHFGFDGPNSPDDLALIPTTDKYVALAIMQTDGASFEIMTGDIIDWLKDMEKDQPIELTEAGVDYCAGNFKTPLKDAMGLAQRMYAFCPDIVDQGTGDVDKLADEMTKEGKFFFWWD